MIKKPKASNFHVPKELAKINQLHEKLGLDKLRQLHSKFKNVLAIAKVGNSIDPTVKEHLTKLKGTQLGAVSIMRNTIPLSTIFINNDALEIIRQIKIPDHVRIMSDAGHLYTALKEDDHLIASDILSAYEPVFPLLKQLIALAEMPDDDRLEILKATNEKLQNEIALYKERNKSRTEKATTSRKINAKAHEINSYFLRLENAGRNLYESQITSEISAEFGVSPQHVRKLRKIYLNSKGIKTRN